jgi:outer membrane murein-binding lipoprotein Lpp
MMDRRQLLIGAGLGGALTLLGCHSKRTSGTAKSGRLASAIQTLQTRFKAVLQQPDAYRLQAFLSYPSAAGWQHESYRADAEWTAPASMVKLPMAMLALRKLTSLGLPLTTQLRIVDPASCGAQFLETAQYETFERCITRMLVVSDNGAFNRLFEFVGIGETNRQLQALGFADAYIQARLGTCYPEDNARGRAYQLADSNGVLLGDYPADPDISIVAVTPAPLIGKAYLDFDDKRIEQPRDFAKSNHWRLANSHALLLAIAKPQALFAELTPEHQQFLRKTMSMLPRQAGFDEANYPDAWGKFLLHGDQQIRLPDSTRITNKIGQAYGFLTDSAWLEDDQHQCVLSAIIYVNADGVLNDDKYEYDDIGFPLLAELGRAALALCPR